MKAITYSNYGTPEVLQLQDIKKPTPGDNEILIKVIASSVTAGDSRMRAFQVPAAQWIFARLYLGIFTPRRPVLGMELSGVVESIGAKVTRFNVGDEVFASTLNAGFGAYAEYKCFPENGAVSLKPGNLTFAEAATLPIGAGTALRFLRNANVQAGQNILVYGASGSVGTFAIQLAKYYQATVTAVCSTSSLELVQTLEPNRIFDYTKDTLDTWGKYDLVFDAVGKITPSQIKQLLCKEGKLISVKSNPGNIKAEDLELIKQFVESNVLRPIITKSFPLEKVAEAHRLVDSGRKKGNISIAVI